MKTTEWKAAALRSDVFSSPGLRRLVNAGKKTARECSSSSPVGFVAMSPSSGKSQGSK